MTMTNENQKPIPQPIDPDALYPFQSLSLIGLGLAAIRSMQEQGLPCHYACNRGFVLGSNLIDHIVEHGSTSRTSSGGRPGRLLD
jgi:hypothetical protein